MCLLGPWILVLFLDKNKIHEKKTKKKKNWDLAQSLIASPLLVVLRQLLSAPQSLHPIFFIFPTYPSPLAHPLVPLQPKPRSAVTRPLHSIQHCMSYYASHSLHCRHCGILNPEADQQCSGLSNMKYKCFLDYSTWNCKTIIPKFWIWKLIWS